VSDPREKLAVPWEGWSSQSDEARLAHLLTQTAGEYAADSPEQARAAGLVVAFGNYVWLAPDSDARTQLIASATAELRRIDPSRSRYWG
jgi:hypothetical protein